MRSDDSAAAAADFTISCVAAFWRSDDSVAVLITRVGFGCAGGRVDGDGWGRLGIVDFDKEGIVVEEGAMLEEALIETAGAYASLFFGEGTRVYPDK